MPSLVDVLSRGLDEFKWRQGSPWAGSLCPFPDHKDNKPSFRINLERGFYSCFGCKRSGSLQELLAVIGYPVSKTDSLLESVQFIKQAREEHLTETLPEYVLAAFRRCPKELLRAGFSKNVLAENDIGYDLSRYTVTFPLRSRDGVLSAIYRRVPEGDPKYLVYTFEEFEGYKPRPKKHLWGLHKIYASAFMGGSPGPLVVTEGFKACMWVQQSGFNAVATMGASLTVDQRRLIAELDLPTIMMFDNDEAGDYGTIVAYKQLRRRVSDLSFASYPRDKHQPDNLTEDEVKKTLNNPKTFSDWSKTCLISQRSLAKRILGCAAPH